LGLRHVLRAQKHLAAERGRALVRLDLAEPRVFVPLIAKTVVREHAAFDKERGRIAPNLKTVNGLLEIDDLFDRHDLSAPEGAAKQVL